MDIQGAYLSRLAPSGPGAVANGEPANIVTRTLQETDATASGLPFGVVVRRGTTDGSIQDASAATPFLGVLVQDPTLRPTPGAPPDRCFPDRPTAVLTKGVVWVRSLAPVIASGGAVYFDATGAITSTATNNTAVLNAVFDNTSDTSGLVKVRLS